MKLALGEHTLWNAEYFRKLCERLRGLDRRPIGGTHRHVVERFDTAKRTAWALTMLWSEHLLVVGLDVMLTARVVAHMGVPSGTVVESKGCLVVGRQEIDVGAFAFYLRKQGQSRCRGNAYGEKFGCDGRHDGCV